MHEFCPKIQDFEHHLLGLFISYQQSHSLFLSILFAGSCHWKYAGMSLPLFSDRSYQLVLLHNQTESYQNYCGHSLHTAYLILQVWAKKLLWLASYSGLKYLRENLHSRFSQIMVNTSYTKQFSYLLPTPNDGAIHWLSAEP